MSRLLKLNDTRLPSAEAMGEAAPSMLALFYLE
jgi:hypothetical protein